MQKILITILLAFSLMATTATCFAQATSRPPIVPDTGVELLLPHTTPKAGETQQQNVIGVILPSITTIVIAMAGALAFLFIIIGGIQILTAYGDDEKIGNAKKTITYAIVGLLISMMSYAIVSIISSIKI